MSKSDLGHELLQDQVIAADEDLLTQKSSQVPTKPPNDLDVAEDVTNNVVTGALGLLDVNRREGKPWNDGLTETGSPPDAETGRTSPSLRNQSETSVLPSVQVMHLRIGDDGVCDSAVHAEQVAKIVKGLKDIQIGDSAYVQSVDGSNIEKQVKRAVRNINSLEFGDMETAQLIVCDGQGDVDTAIMEAELGPPNNSKPQVHEAPKISSCFLHKMIEELEENDNTTTETKPDHRNKEGIAIWEEAEEKLIRVIEGPDEEDDPAVLPSENREPLDTESPSGSTRLADSLAQSRELFTKEDIIAARECSHRTRDLLDNYTDEEPYWCTAGLITGVVTSPHHRQVFPSQVTMTGMESGTSNVEGNFQLVRSESSTHEDITEDTENAEEKLEIVEERSKVKEKKKKSFGRRVRHFFSKFARSKDHC